MRTSPYFLAHRSASGKVDVAMTVHPLIKILVVLFSLTLGGFMTWQLTKSLTQQENKTQQGESPSPDKEKEDQAYALPVGPKSVGGSLDIGGNIFPVTPKEIKPQPDGETKPPPLLPSSKSGTFILPKKEPNRPLLPSSKSRIILPEPPQQQNQE